MPLLDALKATGVKPSRPTVTGFFAQHPELADEVLACRTAGYTWPQIVAQIAADYGVTLHSTSLSSYYTNRG